VQTRRVVDLARSFPPAEAEPSVADLLLEGFAARSTAGYVDSPSHVSDRRRSLVTTTLVKVHSGLCLAY
jgi:hypothetical protein